MGLHSISKISKKLKISYSRIYRILEANGNPVKKEDKSLCRNKDFQIKITSEQLNIITLTLAEELKLAVETYERFISNNDLKL